MSALWGTIVGTLISLWVRISSYLGRKRKLSLLKTLLTKEIKTNQRKLETLEKMVNEGLREGKDPFKNRYDFQQPEISISFEMKNYQGLTPFEVLPDEYPEKIEKYYHKLMKLEEAWNSFVAGEPRGPEIEIYPPTSPSPITKARGHALEVKAVVDVALDLGKELLFYLEDQQGDENAPRVEYIAREGGWWNFWK